MMPIYLEKIPQDVRDKEILLTAIIAELDAVNLYERLAAMTKGKRP
jgi:rubrerythrin